MAEPRFCPQCGHILETRLSENRSRLVCPACGFIHYGHWKVCAATIVIQDDQVLLIQRARPPYVGAWGLPAGYVEADETPDQAARRETLEETGLHVELGPLLGVYPFTDDPRGHGLLHTYLARLRQTADDRPQTADPGDPPSSITNHQSPISNHYTEGQPAWWPLAALPDSLVGAGQAEALLAWRDAALRGGAETPYCTRCGAPTELRELYGRRRPQCPACGLVQFREPKTTSGVLITADGCILLARRGVSPGKGLWYLPSGYVDWDERVDEAAIREMAEETGLAVAVTGLFGVYPFGDPHAGYGTFVLYRGRVVGGQLRAGDDVTEVAYFAPDALPELAFDTSRLAVAQWVSEQT